MPRHPFGVTVWHLVTYHFPITIPDAVSAAPVTKGAKDGRPSLPLGPAFGWLGSANADLSLMHGRRARDFDQ